MANDSHNLSYKYKIVFGDKISGEAEKLLLHQGEGKVFNDGTNEYSLIFLGVKVSRKIYQPCQIEAELNFMEKTASNGKKSVTVPSFKDVSALLLQRLVTLEIEEVYDGGNTKAPVKYGKSYPIAQNYYVYELDHLLKTDTNGSLMYVKLNIFSMDKLMTLNKYSKAYVARKLGSTILQPESLLFGKTADGKEPLIKTDISGLQFLKYSVSEKPDPSRPPLEFIQPYLVQYNETFYDFMVRTSNRCGEFLFFENGSLNLGLPKSADPPLEIESYGSITAKEVSQSTITVGSFMRDSIKDNPSDVGDLNQSVIDRGSTGFPHDIFPDTPSSNAELSNDEYLFPLFKDKFSNVKREMYYDGDFSHVAMARTFPWLKTLLANEKDKFVGLGVSFAKAAIVTEGVTVGLSLLNQNGVNSSEAKHHISPYEDKTEQYKDGKVVQFGTLEKTGWTTIDYYRDIRKFEELQQKQTICIDMDDRLVDVKLGQKLKVKGLGDTYIVIQIEQVSEEKWERNYDKYDSSGNDVYPGKRSLKIYAIPIYKSEEGENSTEKFYPPVQPVPVIRKSGPQTAFVTDNDDPKYQGRVRIVYPWQTLKKDMKAALVLFDSSLKENKEKENEIIQRLVECNALLGRLLGQRDKLVAYCEMSEQKRKEKMSEYEAELENLDRDIKRDKIEKAKIESQKDASNKRVTSPFSPVLLKLKLEKIESTIEEKKRKRREKEAWIIELKECAKHYDENRNNGNYKFSEHNPIIKKYDKEYSKATGKKKDLEIDLKKLADYIKKNEELGGKYKEYVETEIGNMASPWVRIATPMATPGGGTFFKPRVGDEVLVNYDNDNVERPYVVGSLFSKNNLTPDESLARKSGSVIHLNNISMSLMSPNGHHITFTDPPGGMGFVTNAISPGLGFYGAVLGLNNNLGDSFKELGGGIHIGDTYGVYELELNSHRRAIDIKSPFGTVNIDAFSGITINAPNGDIMIKGKNITLEAGNKINLLSGKNIADPGIGDKGFGNTVLDALGGIEDNLVDKFVSSVVDFSLIRHVVEVFVRPVDGTLCLKSKRYLKLEAGKGNATIRANRYASRVEDKHNKSERFFVAMLSSIRFISGKVDEFYNGYQTLWQAAHDKYKAYYKVADGNLKRAQEPCLTEIADRQTRKQENIINKDTYKDKLTEKCEKDKEQFFATSDILKNANDYVNAAIELQQYRKNFYTTISNGRDRAIVDPELKKIMDSLKDTEDFCKKKTESFEWNKDNETYIFFNKTAPMIDCFSSYNKTLIKRQLILAFLKGVSESDINQEGKYLSAGYEMDKILKDKTLSKEYYWKRQVLYMEKDRRLQHPFLRTIWDNSVKKVFDKLKSNFAPFDRDIWNDKADGQILFSDQEGSTLNFDGAGLHEETNSNIGTMDHFKKELMGIE